MAIAAPAIAYPNQILGADVSAAGLPVSGYGSDGTFDGLSGIAAQQCAATTGPQSASPTQGLSVAACQPAQYDQYGNQTQPAEPLPQADFSVLGLPVSGIDTNGTYDAVRDACTAPFVPAVPTETVAPAPGLSVTVCGPSN
jgi:hypothetical protein